MVRGNHGHYYFSDLAWAVKFTEENILPLAQTKSSPHDGDCL
jgi:hypothetical protein